MSVVITERSPLETEIQRVSRDLWNESRGETPSVFDSNLWIGRLLDWSMRNPELKVDLFRLVDVLPALRTASGIHRHVEEYLGPDRDALPQGARALFRVATSALPAAATAKAVEKAVREMALRFIVGEDPVHALPALRRLNADGFGATVDLLGEATLSEAEAVVYQQAYLDLIDRLSEETAAWPSCPVLEKDHHGALPRANVSVKLSALEPHLDPADAAGSVSRLVNRVLPILRRAVERQVFVNFDMEQWALHGIALDLFEYVLTHGEFRAWPHLGMAIQAYARSAQRDLEHLQAVARERGTPLTVRLVKGAYWDYEVVHARQNGYVCPVFEDKAATDANYETLSAYLLKHHEHLKPAFGSHNLRSIGHALAQAEALGVPGDALEFQMLYGMAEPLRRALRERGYRVRVYAPVGALLPGMAYLVRRLLENTSNEGFLRQGYHDRKSLDALLAKPSPAVAPDSGTRKAVPDLAAPFANAPLCDFTRDEERKSLADAVEKVATEFPIRIPVVSGRSRMTQTTFPRISPNDGRTVVATVSDAEKPDVEKAVQTAMQAWPAWRDRDVWERAGLLERLAGRLAADRCRLAALQVHEVAKPWAEADAEVAEAIDFCRYYARRAIEELSPRAVGNVPGEANWMTFQGRGPTAVIVPWNFPVAIPCGVAVAALVSGNPILLKPAEQSSACAYALFQHMMAAGIPPEVAHFLPGHGEVIGPWLVEHPLVAQVAFTGSREVGLSILERIGVRRAGQPQLKRAVCELGGKNAIIVDEDADLDEAVKGVLYSAFGYAGQKCSAGSRVIVLSGVFDAFVPRLIEACRSLHAGPATDPACQVPPVVDEPAYRRLMAVTNEPGPGAETVFRGETMGRAGHYVAPAIFQIQDSRHPLMQEELFGPILAVTRADTFEEALGVALDSEYALTGAVYSRQPSHLAMARERFRVGNLYLNRGCTGSKVGRQPFGGFGMSGTDAKAGGPGYLMHFVDPVCITENTMRRGFTPEIML